MSAAVENDIPYDMIPEMVFEENRLHTFLEKGQWPFLKGCNCTPEKMASAGFFWCGSENQPDLVRCFVCLKEFEDWEPDDIPKDEHKRLCPLCPFVKLGKPQDNCTVKEVLELCEKSLTKLMEKKNNFMLDRYTAKANNVRKELEIFAEQNNIDISD